MCIHVYLYSYSSKEERPSYLQGKMFESSEKLYTFVKHVRNKGIEVSIICLMSIYEFFLFLLTYVNVYYCSLEVTHVVGLISRLQKPRARHLRITMR